MFCETGIIQTMLKVYLLLLYILYLCISIILLKSNNIWLAAINSLGYRGCAEMLFLEIYFYWPSIVIIIEGLFHGAG